MIISIKLKHFEAKNGGRYDPYFVGEEAEWRARNKPHPNQAKIVGIDIEGGKLRPGKAALINIVPLVSESWTKLAIGDKLYLMNRDVVCGEAKILAFKKSIPVFGA